MNRLYPTSFSLLSPADELVLARLLIPLREEPGRLAGLDDQHLRDGVLTDGLSVFVAGRRSLSSRWTRLTPCRRPCSRIRTGVLRPVGDDPARCFGPGRQAVQEVVGRLGNSPNALGLIARPLPTPPAGRPSPARCRPLPGVHPTVGGRAEIAGIARSQAERRERSDAVIEVGVGP